MLYLSSGDVLIGASLSRNTYKQPTVAQAQLTDDNFAARLCLLCIPIAKRETRFVSPNVGRSWQRCFFALFLLWEVKRTYSSLLLSLVRLSSISQLPPRFQCTEIGSILPPGENLSLKLEKTGPGDKLPRRFQNFTRQTSTNAPRRRPGSPEKAVTPPTPNRTEPNRTAEQQPARSAPAAAAGAGLPRAVLNVLYRAPATRCPAGRPLLPGRARCAGSGRKEPPRPL